MFEEENRWCDPIAGGTNFHVKHHIIFRKNIRSSLVILNSVPKKVSEIKETL